MFIKKRNMVLTSDAFHHEHSIPSKYTCDGENINPPLKIDEVPEGAKSLVLIMDDPDVPSSVREDNNWDHWLVWNIPPNTEMIAENSAPPGTVGRNTGGKYAYGGPCPPDREHRYFFKLYALDKELDLESDATKADIEKAMNGSILSEAVLMGTYERQ